MPEEGKDTSVDEARLPSPLQCDPSSIKDVPQKKEIAKAATPKTKRPLTKKMKRSPGRWGKNIGKKRKNGTAHGKSGGNASAKKAKSIKERRQQRKKQELLTRKNEKSKASGGALSPPPGKTGNIVCAAPPTAGASDAPDDGDFFWEMEKVVGRRVQRGRVEYLIRWKGCPEDQNTWEPASNLCDTAMSDALKYWREEKAKMKKREEDERRLFGGGDDRAEDAEPIAENDGDAKMREASAAEAAAASPAGIADATSPTGLADASPPEPMDTEEVEENEEEDPSTLVAPHELDALDARWEWTDAEQVKFQDVERINVNDPNARKIVTEARVNGKPLVLVGHVGWANFAKRWLRRRKEHASEPTPPVVDVFDEGGLDGGSDRVEAVPTSAASDGDKEQPSKEHAEGEQQPEDRGFLVDLTEAEACASEGERKDLPDSQDVSKDQPEVMDEEPSGGGSDLVDGMSGGHADEDAIVVSNGDVRDLLLGALPEERTKNELKATSESESGAVNASYITKNVTNEQSKGSVQDCSQNEIKDLTEVKPLSAQNVSQGEAKVHPESNQQDEKNLQQSNRSAETMPGIAGDAASNGIPEESGGTSSKNGADETGSRTEQCVVEQIEAKFSDVANDEMSGDNSNKVCSGTAPKHGTRGPDAVIVSQKDSNVVDLTLSEDDGEEEGENDLLLDLSKPYELDVTKMIEDIGMEDVPVVRRNYNESKPIHGEIPAGKFLKSCWPPTSTESAAQVTCNAQSRGAKEGAVSSSSTHPKLYLHQWQFPLSDTAGRKLCHQNTPLPHDILGEDLLRHWLDLPQCKSDSPLQYLFMGREETLSKLHRDNGGLAISIAPIVGEKECVLVHRSDGSNCLYHLEAKLEDVDLHAYPLLSQARIWKTVVKPGEILLMPQGTYHQCRNVTPCLSYSRFHLDTVNLLSFLQSMIDGDAPEMEHGDVLWNCTSELIRKVDSLVDQVQARVKCDPPRPVPKLDEKTANLVDTLRELRNIVREVARRTAVREAVKGTKAAGQGGGRSNASAGGTVHDWNILVDDVDMCLHEFHYRRVAKIPTFRPRRGKALQNALKGGVGYRRAGGQMKVEAGPIVAYNTDLDRAYLALRSASVPSDASGLDATGIERLVKGSKVVARLEQKRVKGTILQIEPSLHAAYLSYEDYPSLYDEYQPYELLRVPTNYGGGGAEVRHEEVVPGLIVLNLVGEKKEVYRAVVQSTTCETMYKLLLDLGGCKIERWMTRRSILERVGSVPTDDGEDLKDPDREVSQDNLKDQKEAERAVTPADNGKGPKMADRVVTPSNGEVEKEAETLANVTDDSEAQKRTERAVTPGDREDKQEYERAMPDGINDMKVSAKCNGCPAQWEEDIDMKEEPLELQAEEESKKAPNGVCHQVVEENDTEQQNRVSGK